MCTNKLSPHTHARTHTHTHAHTNAHTHTHTQESSDPGTCSCAVDLIKYFDRLYRHSPDFRKLAATQEFIDALSSVLFPPVSFSDIGKSTSESERGEGDGDNEWVSAVRV